MLCVNLLQVRTPKFLFACAVGFPALKPTWISESICREELLPETSYWHKPKKSTRKLAAGHKGAWDVSPSGNKLWQDSIFHNLKIYLHGKPSFCTQMKALIEAFPSPLSTIFASHRLGNKCGHKVLAVGYL
jgi:hypothetical protein